MPSIKETSIQTNFRRAKILVIEDNEDHWQLIKNALQQYLSEVAPVWVASAQQALALLNDWGQEEWEVPKLILQDLYLPTREEGWNLLQQIKALPAPCSQIPVVMFSASNETDDINETYLRGSASYLVKPVTFSEWAAYFQELRSYWWETVSLPPMRFSTL
ncbi:response regulator [Spirosoma sp. KUDC1026]|uniref:response regulator n=1 Tax=Spirosoma sp. KUDC1026 TaxID=2745947 RepID=UPI00159BE465|nr:response regulator [Spirosoma sp. KUDC1026]QKZ13922.1 response regulator [Spirosoma sp. KUDC1026]